MTGPSFHSYTDRFVLHRWWTDSVHGIRRVPVETRDVTYRFSNHFHPFVGDAPRSTDAENLRGLATRLIREGVAGLERADTATVTGDDVLTDATDSELFDPSFFTDYQPSERVVAPHPIKDLDFSVGGAYSVYNWELFFHIPLTIAIHLSRNQRFREAQGWFHLLYDPTDDTDAPIPQRFFKVRPFQEATGIHNIGAILHNLADPTDEALLDSTLSAIREWTDKPFRPHAVARHRISAYMYKTVLAYLDNLITWGDLLFRQDTRESISEATQLYVLAANILGPRPQEVPPSGQSRPLTYADMRGRLDEFGGFLARIETMLPFDIHSPPGDTSDDATAAGLPSVTSLYFCVPRNDRILEYWDTVADRLFKIRNSLNIRGIFRQLALFAPPIDPALLAAGVAAGLDVEAVIAGLNQPLPLVRFQFLIGRALELAGEVRALGSSLLSAIEREDEEKLALLRSSHERAMLDVAEAVRYAQWQEALKSREAVERSLDLAVRRYVFYERLLGTDPNDIELPELEDIDPQQLLTGRLRSGEPDLAPRDIEVDIATELLSDVTVTNLFGAGNLHLNSGEAWGLRTRTIADVMAFGADVLDLISGGTELIPDPTIAAHPYGVGTDAKVPGGEKISRSMQTTARVMRAGADATNRLGGRMETAGAYARREQEWAFQSTLAAGEVDQIHKQLRAAQIREFIAEREYKNHQKQMAHAEEIERFLSDERDGQTTTEAFYSWMRRETQALHHQSFELAFDVAKKAERALQHELGDSTLSYLKYNYSAGKEGLLAGEKLTLDLRRMEIDYHDRNRREYELTKNVSLLQIDPLALIRLRATGRCTFALPEDVFVFDGPSHYFRRIRWFGVTIPSVVGRFVSVNCTVRLLRSSIRTTPDLNDGYARSGAEDPRFNDNFGMIESVVTSSSQDDTGMHQPDPNDTRYLPFEGSGVISEWQVELPADPSQAEPSQFDYSTITDVIMTIRYTAREGGQPFRNAAMRDLTDRIDASEATGTTRMFSVRHEFPTEWAQFKSSTITATNPTAALRLTIRPEHYPFWSQGRLNQLTRFQIAVRTENTAIRVGASPDLDADGIEVSTAGLGPLLLGERTGAPLPAAIGEVTLHLSNADVDDLWILAAWGP
jgi:Tc toxin complex TcA C-terminal TcB-binding domain